jgi:hypothetical protein
MAESLTAFIARTGDLPFIWGERDCTLWVADWCVRHFGFDPAHFYRGTYDNEAQANALTGGDLAAFVAPELAKHLVRKEPPSDGDIAIIAAYGREIAAIRQGRFWAIKTENGLAHLRARAIAIWGV